MAGKPQYSDDEILWFVKQVFEFKIRNEDLVCEGFKKRFGRELKSHQHKYLKGRYGRDPAFNCPAITGVAFLVKPAISEEAKLPIMPLGQNYTVMACHSMEVHGNVDQCLNSSQPTEEYGNVDQGFNGGNSGMAAANHYTTARHPTASNNPRQPTETPVPVPRRANLSGSSIMYTASRADRAERRHRAARAAAWQQAQAAVHADEQVERQLQNRQQVHGMRQNIERLQMPGIPQPQYPANQTPMLWPPANVSPSTQQAHFSHGMQQAQGIAQQETFASEQPHWTMNPYSGHQPPVAGYPQQATYVGNHGQELSTQWWIETPENYLQERQSAAPVAYTGNHGQELRTGPLNGTQGPHLQEIQYSAPAAPEAVFNAPEQYLATSRETEENQQEPAQGMQNPYERNREPYPSPALSHGQLQQSMPLSRRESLQSVPLSYRDSQQSLPLSRGESQQGMPLSRGESRQSMPLSHGESQQSEPPSEGGQAAYENSQEHTPVRQPSTFSYQVISIQHLQQLLARTSNDTENTKEQDGEVDDFNIADFINLENVL